jgi:hypothetical protein
VVARVLRSSGAALSPRSSPCAWGMRGRQTSQPEPRTAVGTHAVARASARKSTNSARDSVSSLENVGPTMP